MATNIAFESTSPALRAILGDIDRAHLQPIANNIREAHSKANRIITELHSGRDLLFSVKDVVEHGSLSRGTGLRQFKDLDKLVVLDSDALRTQKGDRRTPADAIARLAASISGRRAGLVKLGSITIRRQDHSVGIVYPHTNFRIDLVPGLREHGRVMIPERGTGEWIATHSDEVADRLRRASIIDTATTPIIRLLKGWARARGRFAPLPSFAIETLVVNSILHEPMPLDCAVEFFLSAIAESDGRRPLVLGRQGPAESRITVIDPVSQKNLTPEITRKQQSTLISTSREACQKMIGIRKLIAQGSLRKAQALARDVFVGSAWL